MKKVLWAALVIALVMGMTLAGACGEETTTTSSPAQTTATTATATTQSSASTEAPTSTTVPAATGPKYGGVLKVENATMWGPVGWPADPIAGGCSFLGYFNEGLIRNDWENNILPWLATDWDLDIAADGSATAIFDLRQGVKFHDGTDFNADAVAYCLNAYAEEQARPWTKVTALDTYRVEIFLPVWKNTFWTTLVSTANAIVSPTAVETNGKDWLRQHPVGTGPFKVTEYSSDKGVTMVKNTEYWQEGKPYLDSIQVIYLDEFTTKRDAMIAGEIDQMAFEIGYEASQVLELGLPSQVKYNATCNMYPDSKSGDSPWGNIKVREALSYAIDREGLAAALGYGLCEAKYSIIPRDMPGYDPDYKGQPYDPEKAKQLLAEAGYPNGFETKFVIYPTMPKDLGAALQKFVADIGITAQVEYPQLAGYAEYRNATWKNAILVEPAAFYPDVVYLPLTVYWNPEGYMFASMDRTPEFIAAYNAAVTAPYPDTALNAKVFDVLQDQFLVIPIWEVGRGFAHSEDLMGTDFFKYGYWFIHPIEEAWLDR